MWIFTVMMQIIMLTGNIMVGVGIALFLTSHTLNNKNILVTFDDINTNDTNDNNDNNDTNDTNDTNNTNSLPFEEMFLEEFNNIKPKELPEQKVLESYASSVTTPSGEVLMTYSQEDKAFYYYSNNRNIPIRFLDIVSKKFVIDHDCKVLYREEPLVPDVELDAEPNAEPNAEPDAEPEDSSESYYTWLTNKLTRSSPPDAEPDAPPDAPPDAEPDAEPDAPDAPPQKSVFATYKKNPEVKEKNNNEIEKIMNKYKFCGTINDYTSKKEKKVNEAIEMSFSKYKEMIKNKTE